MSMLVVRCPFCGHDQKTNPVKVFGAVKRCVFCGRSFKIRSDRTDRIVRTRN